jgi:hypothetical protein
MRLLLAISRIVPRRFCLILVFCLTASAGKASIVFNWPNPPGWTAGTPGQGATVSQSFTSVNPNDITVQIQNNGVNVQGTYPQIDSTTSTGGFTNVNGLQLYISSTPQFGNTLTTTISFASPVTNLTFQLWDIDAKAGQFADMITNLKALAPDGVTIFGASSVTSAVPGYNTITGTGLSTVILGTASADNTTNQGTINITFNQPLVQFSFDWSNNDNGRGAQAIAIGPLTYDPVPEHDSALSVSATCLIAIIGEKVRRRARKSSQPLTKS